LSLFLKAHWTYKQLYNYSILGIIFILVLIIKNGIHIILGTRLTIDQDVNPNQLAMGIAQMAAVVIAHLINNKKRIIDYFLIIILISILFLTGSRSGIIAVLLCFIMVYIIAIRKTVSRKKKVRNIVGIILLCGIVYFIYFYLKERISFLMYRFTYENIIATHGTSRMMYGLQS
jgi:O-antigen ligase